MNNNAFDKAIIECKNHMQVDFLPLHDIYRAIYGLTNSIPAIHEFDSTLKLLSILLEDENIICVEGPEMMPTNRSNKDLIIYLKNAHSREEYDKINYRFWLDYK